MSFRFAVEGRPDAATHTAGWRAVTPAYFATMGIPVVGGRAFAERDDDRAPPVVLVNRTLAERAFPGGDAIGARIRTGDEGEPWRTIVGVVGDVKHMGLAADEGPAIYTPLAQKPDFLRWMTFVARTDVAPEALVAPVRAAVHAIDPEQPIFDVATMERIRDRSIAGPRFYTAVLGAFAAVALALALVGVYAVVAFWVGQRTREIGIRLALGAGRGDILGLVLRTGLRLAGLGVALGIGGALALSHALERLLFDVSATDALTFAAIAAAFLVAATVACALPAGRAVRTSPLVALSLE